MSPSDTVRLAFERFNRKDFAGALEVFHSDAQHADLLREGVFHRGRPAILKLWTERFAEASAHALIEKMSTQGNVVVAFVRYQAYEPDGAPYGSPMLAVHRFVFRDDRIARVDATVLNALADDTKAMFLEPA